MIVMIIYIYDSCYIIIHHCYIYIYKWSRVSCSRFPPLPYGMGGYTPTTQAPHPPPTFPHHIHRGGGIHCVYTYISYTYRIHLHIHILHTYTHACVYIYTHFLHTYIYTLHIHIGTITISGGG